MMRVTYLFEINRSITMLTCVEHGSRKFPKGDAPFVSRYIDDMIKIPYVAFWFKVLSNDLFWLSGFFSWKA